MAKKKTKKASDKNITIKLSGSIDEMFSLDLNSYDISKSIVLDLEEIKNTKASGLRTLVRVIQSYKGKKTLTLKRCPIHFIEQINMMVDILAKKVNIESFYVPYISKTSGEAITVLYVNGKDFLQSSEAGSLELKVRLKIKKGEEVFVPDFSEFEYFVFLRAA